MTDSAENAYRNYFESTEFYSFIYQATEVELSTKVLVPDCSEVVRCFYNFMLGTGLSREAVRTCFKQVLEEQK